LLVLVGVAKGDTQADAAYLVDKVATLRIFPDADGKMNLNVQQAGGALLIVSQFTLLADCRRGRRPGFDAAAPPEMARELFDHFVSKARETGLPVSTGVFQATMEVGLLNYGPVTIWIDSKERGDV
jgi:D-tyrosyl-tRNA(Tyr) deacylase